MPLISIRLPLAVALLCLSACDREPKPPAQPQTAAASDDFAGTIDRSHAGSALPQITVSDASGAKLSIGALKGKPVLINLWATWCGPCIRELPTLDTLAGRVAVVTVSQDMAGPDKVAATLGAHSHGHLHAWLDPDNTLAFFFNSGVLPTSVLFDAKGHEVWRMVGAHDWSGSDSAALIAPAMP